MTRTARGYPEHSPPHAATVPPRVQRPSRGVSAHFRVAIGAITELSPGLRCGVHHGRGSGVIFCSTSRGWQGSARAPRGLVPWTGLGPCFSWCPSRACRLASRASPWPRVAVVHYYVPTGGVDWRTETDRPARTAGSTLPGRDLRRSQPRASRPKRKRGPAQQPRQSQGKAKAERAAPIA